jgi:hypothetical protein
MSTTKLGANNRDIHQNNQDIDVNEVLHHAAGGISRVRRYEAHHLPGLPHVEARDDELLYCEPEEHDFLVDFKRLEEGLWVWGVGAVVQDCRRDGEEKEAQDDHFQDPSDRSSVVNDQVKPGVKDNGLAKDHGNTANGDDCDVCIGVTTNLKEL